MFHKGHIIGALAGAVSYAVVVWVFTNGVIAQIAGNIGKDRISEFFSTNIFIYALPTFLFYAGFIVMSYLGARIGGRLYEHEEVQ